MKARTGYVYQNKQTRTWYARVTVADERGKRQNVQRKGLSKSHAREVLKELIRLLDHAGPKAIDAQRITFADLCDYFETHYVTQAQYVGSRKVAGLRSVVTVRGYVKVVRQHFGRQLLQSLTYEDLRSFRLARLNTSTQQSAKRSLTTVNREMAYLRRMLNIAERTGWIPKNPFKMGDALIHAADEVKRERIIDCEEERRLLAACVGPRRHLRGIIICALDTGMRQGEILTLSWRDVNMNDGVITIWLEWCDQYRNVFVHRGRRLKSNQTHRREGLLFDAKGEEILRARSTLHLAKHPDKSDAEALVKKDMVLNEDADITFKGIYKSCRDLSEAVCERLVSVWQERRNNPSLIEQPASQWDTKIRDCKFSGYDVNAKPLKSNLMTSHPILRHRLLAASADDAHHAGVWKNSPWNQ